MADPQFFTKSKAFSLKEIADITGAEMPEDADANMMLEDVAALDEAGASHLTFFDNVKYKDQFIATNAGVCVTYPDKAGLAPDGVVVLTSPSPYKAYALAAQAFYPDAKPAGDISPAAHIDASAKVGEGAVIEAGVVIGADVVIGDHAWIEANSVIGRGVQLGQRVRIGSNVTLSHCHIGDHTRLYPGVRIGQDGFGFAIDPRGHVKVPQLGRVMIGDHVEIGANTTIDRGAGPDSCIGDGTWIDNLVQIGHNVKIGRGCIIVSQVGISGSTVLEDFVALGGQVGVAGHLNIGMGVRVAAQSGVMRNIPAGEEHMGSPAMPIRQFMKQTAYLKRLLNKG